MKGNDNIFIDSNVWVYLASQQDNSKKKIAVELIDGNFDSIVLSVQVLVEIFTVLDKKTNIPTTEIEEITCFYANTFPVIASGKDLFFEATKIRLKLGYSFFDSMVIATALKANCSILYTEDPQHNQLIENKLRIINPFL